MFALLQKGGFMMIPIVLCSVVALAIVLERLIVIGRVRTDDDTLALRVKRAVAAGRVSEAISICNQAPGPLPRIFKKALSSMRLGREELRESITRAGELEIARLERRLPGLATIAATAPLLGFLGTVLGMIDAFRRIEQLGGNVNASVLAGGIWEALITTAAGLSVAIPTLFLHNYLASRIKGIVMEMEDRSADLLQSLTSVQEREDHAL